MGGFDRDRCGECRRWEDRCPECGSDRVSVDGIPDDGDYTGSLGPDLDGLAYRGEHGAYASYALVCWGCGWAEERRLSVSVHAVDHGDAWEGDDAE